MEEKGGWTDVVIGDLADFIAARDSFYLATTSGDGQPYAQHRGGEPGFLSAPRRRVTPVEEGSTQTVVGLIW